MRYSVIIPVFNRPDEVDELLQSLIRQRHTDFEVIVVEDGSSLPCRDVVEKFREKLDIHYYNKPNSGPGQTRNYAAERSNGEYLIILDSDCILPEGYFTAVEEELRRKPSDAFGGRTRARLVYRHTESHQLLHDVFLHHRRHTRREEEDGQVLSQKFQHGSTQGNIPNAGRLLGNALRRGHRLQHPHLQGRIYVPPVSRRMGIPQTADGFEKVLQAGT